jgi:hypothetical protein
MFSTKVTNETRYNYTQNEVILQMSTKGNKYSYEVYQDKWDKDRNTYTIKGYVNNAQTSSRSGIPTQMLKGELTNIINLCSSIDGINYFVNYDRDMIFPTKENLYSMYPYIVAYGKLLQSNDDYVEQEVNKAYREKAPHKAICRDVSEWKTIETLSAETLAQVNKHIKK